MSTLQEPPHEEDPHRRKEKREKTKKKSPYLWSIKIFFFSLIATAVLSFISGEMLEEMNVIVAFVVLVIFILLNVVFDTIGLAVATADESGFHSMAARRNVVGKKAVWLLRNEEKVASFCNDVVGDICGVISGATGIAIATRVFQSSEYSDWWTLLMTSCIAAFIVGGKAIGKRLAIEKSEEIVTFVAKLLCVFRKESRRENKNGDT